MEFLHKCYMIRCIILTTPCVLLVRASEQLSKMFLDKNQSVKVVWSFFKDCLSIRLGWTKSHLVSKVVKISDNNLLPIWGTFKKYWPNPASFCLFWSFFFHYKIRWCCLGYQPRTEDRWPRQIQWARAFYFGLKYSKDVPYQSHKETSE